MDYSTDTGFPETPIILYYDEPVQQPPPPSPPASHTEPASLADRIGRSKVYLLSESSAARVGKRKHGEDEHDDMDDDTAETDEDHTYRPNALLLHGSPISYLPTARLFAYATHFDTHPMGLEWVDDNTAVFVFASKSTARTAYKNLQKLAEEGPDIDGFVTANSIPVTVWPPEERINQSLGMGEGLKGTIKMRWAKVDDVKKKGARNDSKFYKKHGMHAGKETYTAPGEKGESPRKRSRRDGEEDPVQHKIRLDDDLDEFLAQDSEEESVEEPPSPPSKMRSDYIAADGRTLLERTSLMREHSTSLESRITAPLPRRRGGERHRLERNGEVSRERRKGGTEGQGGGRRSRGRRGERPVKSQQQLDDELEAFLNDRDG